MTETEIEQFLYHEAALMDEHRYDEWLELWTQDALYWVPCSHQETDPSRHVSIIYDRRLRLEDRVARLKSGDVLAQDPTPRMRRVLSNITISREDASVRCASNFLLVHARNSEQQLWCGRSLHLLRIVEGQLKIAEKTVLLVNSEQEMLALQFLI